MNCKNPQTLHELLTCSYIEEVRAYKRKRVIIASLFAVSVFLGALYVYLQATYKPPQLQPIPEQVR